jgi:hypothetical protein
VSLPQIAFGSVSKKTAGGHDEAEEKLDGREKRPIEVQQFF